MTDIGQIIKPLLVCHLGVKCQTLTQLCFWSMFSLNVVGQVSLRAQLCPASVARVRPDASIWGTSFQVAVGACFKPK